MLRAILLACLLTLPGCLFTKEPVLDRTNSIAAGESPAFMDVVAAWEARYGTDASPREVVENGQRVLPVGDLVVIQEENDHMGSTYYAAGILGERPIFCLLHDRDLTPIAERNGVVLEIEQREREVEEMPAMMGAEGSQADLLAFLKDAFANGALLCKMPGPSGFD